MRKGFLPCLITLSAALFFLPSCKDDSNLTARAPIPDQSFHESFDNFEEAVSRGWRNINRSNPTGRTWFDVAEIPNFGSLNYVVKYLPDWNQAQLTLDSTQFENAPFPQRYWPNAYFSQRAINGYAAISAASGDVLSPFDVSNWLVSPELTIQNGDKVIFYAKSTGLSRLQLWINQTTSLNVGNGVNNTGDFSIKLLDINPTYALPSVNPARAFPSEWTRFEGTVSSLKDPVRGRIGFRYFLQDQSPFRRSTQNPNDFDTIYTQIHRTILGLDEVSYKSVR
jgi:hypothetical protein